jgi:RNA polymerase sigma-70 factor (ECF subfamily)
MEKSERTYKKIISDHRDMIYRLCCAYVRDPDLRKDLFQNILLRIWKGLDLFQDRSSISTWVYRIAVNSSIDFLRKKDDRKYLSEHINLDNIEAAARPGGAEEKLIRSEKAGLMYAAINTLTFIDKTIISLYLEDLSYREISDVVGISEKYVSVKLTRIKKKLNRYLKDYSG